MKLEGSYIIKSLRERVWRLITSPEILQRCVPGCQSLEEAEDGSFKIAMKAGVGSIKGVFNGSIRLDEVRDPEHYKMIVEAKGSSGFLKGEGILDLVEENGETIVNYVGEISVGGTIASVGQRMVQASAKMLAGQFFASIEAEATAWAKAVENNEEFEPPKHGFFRNAIRQIKN